MPHASRMLPRGSSAQTWFFSLFALQVFFFLVATKMKVLKACVQCTELWTSIAWRNKFVLSSLITACPHKFPFYKPNVVSNGKLFATFLFLHPRAFPSPNSLHLSLAQRHLLGPFLVICSLVGSASYSPAILLNPSLRTSRHTYQVNVIMYLIFEHLI